MLLGVGAAYDATDEEKKRKDEMGNDGEGE